MKRAAPCGSWRSPLGISAVAAAQRRLMQPRLQGAAAYWLESRPAEDGRSVLVQSLAGRREDLTPAPFSVRDRVHEYGGGAYLPAGERVFFCNDADQCIYVLERSTARRLTEPGARRYADMVLDAARGRLIAVCEEHGADKVENYLAAVTLADGRVTPLVQGRDFVSSPCLSPDGRQLAWLAWDDPHMPWDGTELWLAELDAAGALGSGRRIAGSEAESLFQPRYAPDGVLHFVSDRSGYWNIYRYAEGAVQPVSPDNADYGYAQWLCGMSSYGFLSTDAIAAVRIEAGRASVVRIELGTGRRETLDSRYTHIEHLDAAEGRVVYLGGAADTAVSVLECSAGKATLLSAAGLAPEAAWLSSGVAHRFPTSDGEQAHLWYYPPRNPDCRVPDGELPPVILRCHGGPTAMNGAALEPRIQFWTSRGFAVADLNYRGSTGYGRAYRRALHGAWGVKDVRDCVHALQWLAAQGLADPKRAVISGSSAGGYTALATLTQSDVFRGGAIQYGLSELETAMRDTHKFEAHYGDTLLGPWPAARDVYRARSPLHAAERIGVPVLFFQGLKDTVVLPDQTGRMVAALTAKGVPALCISFAEEGHGFRRAASLERVLAAELAFYAALFGFTPADPASPLGMPGLA